MNQQNKNKSNYESTQSRWQTDIKVKKKLYEETHRNNVWGGAQKWSNGHHGVGREEVKSNTKPEGRTEVLYKPRGGSDNFHKVISLVRHDVLCGKWGEQHTLQWTPSSKIFLGMRDMKSSLFGSDPVFPSLLGFLDTENICCIHFWLSFRSAIEMHWWMEVQNIK